MPIAVSLALVFAFVLPAFLLFEPFHSGESVGIPLTIVVGLAFFGIASAIFRVFASWWRTRRLLADWYRDSESMELRSVPLPVFKLRHPFPVFAIVGIFRPKLFIAEQILDNLDESEIRAVVRHEFGHIAALDNIKRLSMKICGDVLVLPVGRSLEKCWSQAAETAADEYAVRHGKRTTALDLASALIKIARIVPERPLPPLPDVSFVLRPDDSLAIRIQHLINLSDQDDVSNRNPGRFLIPSIVLVMMVMMVIATDDRVLASIHRVSEVILARLQ